MFLCVHGYGKSINVSTLYDGRIHTALNGWWLPVNRLRYLRGQTHADTVMVGFVMGTGIPTVIGSRVPWVQVWLWYLAHRDIPCTHTMVSQVSTGI